MRFYENNPTYFAPRSVEWRTGTPESRGLSRRQILKLAKRLSGRKQSLSLLVVRGGVLVWEQYFNGSAAFHSNNIHSASKSIMSALVGIAQQKRCLNIDQPITDFLRSGQANAAKITIRHLLQMTSGLEWIEDVTEEEVELEADWVRHILGLKAGAPGKRFNYSTGNTHLLSAVLSRAVKMDVSAFAQKNLFRPLGISVEHWGRDPQGNDSGGCNVYMTPRSLAALGQLFLNRGQWKGKSIVPSAWIEASWNPLRTRAPFDYGYLCWLSEAGKLAEKSLVMFGYGGQYVIVMKEIDLVVVMTNDTNEAHMALSGTQEWALLKELISGMASAVE